MKEKPFVIGLMSGTSLDGLDICYAELKYDGHQYSYRIEAAETIPYTDEWENTLRNAERKNGAELMEFHRAYGKYLGEKVNEFLRKHKTLEKPSLIASHGHTIYHRPEAGYTFQLGDGKIIRDVTGIPVVCDFRSGDVALGGQGAPLVPIGDALLFGNYMYCLNLGGFANISASPPSPLQMERGEGVRRIAFDICPMNYIMNRLAQREGKKFDANGEMAKSGKVIPELMDKLNALPYYHLSPPKSLGREWVEQHVFPLLQKDLTADLLRTFSEHAAYQISRSCNVKAQMLVTGGGAHNEFFIQLLREKCAPEIVVPDKLTVDFKEALIFAFLGYLRANERVNILSSVTGASRDSCGGTMYP